MALLKNKRWELFAQAIGQGMKRQQAYVAAGFSPVDAESNAYRLSRNAQVKARISELMDKGEAIAIAAVAVNKGWILAQLQQTMLDARKADQHSVVRNCIIDIGKEFVGMFKDDKDEFIPWDDPSSISDKQIELMQQYWERRVFGDDEAKIMANRRRAQIEAGIIDVDSEPVAEIEPGAADLSRLSDTFATDAPSSLTDAHPSPLLEPAPPKEADADYCTNPNCPEGCPESHAVQSPLDW